MTTILCRDNPSDAVKMYDDLKERITELEQALNGLRSDYDLNNCRANKYQQALEFIADTDRFDLQVVQNYARTALGRG